jgi:flagellin-specific chaperone FliS
MSTPVPTIDPDTILNYIKNSDIVIVGHVTELKPSEENMATSDDVRATQKSKLSVRKGQWYQALIKIERAYIGNIKNGETLKVYFFVPLPINGAVNLEQKKQYLYLLKVNQNDQIIFANDYYFGFRVLDERPVLKSPITTQEAAKAELVQNIKNGDDELKQLSLDILWPDTDASGIAKKLLLQQSTPMRVKVSAAAFLLRSGDVDALPDAEILIRQAREEQASQSIEKMARSISNLSEQLNSEQLTKLLNTREPSIEFAVGEVIRNNTRKEFASVAVQLLNAEMVNNEEDAHWQIDAKYSAISLLSELRNIPGPGFDEYMNNPNKYIQEYLAWWTKKGKEKYKAT